MHTLTDNLPSHLRDARELCQGYILSEKQAPIHRIVCVGMGGSGIASGIVHDCFVNDLTVPLSLYHDYSLPSWINAYTLIVVVSYSGNTEETLAAATQAHEAGCHVVGLSSGGTLQKMLTDRGHDHLMIPSGMPPRTALGYSFVVQYYLFKSLGCLHTDDTTVTTIADHLDQHRDAIIDQAKKLAHAIKGTIPVIYTPSTMESLGIRSRQQINENAKILCLNHSYPECNHNETLGWTGGDSRFCCIMLIPEQDIHPQNSKRLDLTQAWIESQGAAVYRINLLGDTHIHRLWYGIWFMDQCSVFLADETAIDAKDITCIENFKKQLGKS